MALPFSATWYLYSSGTKAQIRQLAFENARAMLGHIPAQMSLRRSGQALRKRRFSDLARPLDKYHFTSEVLAQLGIEVAGLHRHSPMLW